MTSNAALVKDNKSSTLGQWKYSFWLQGLILFLTSLLISGYQVYSANHAVQIPFIQWINNPSLFPNDPFVSTYIHYIAPIYRVVAIISSYIPLETSLLLLFLITRALILVAAARLAMTLNPNSKLAGVGAMAFFALYPTPIIGHGTLVNNYFEHTSMSVAFLLLATAAFYSMRPYYWALWLAIGFNLNIMYGAYACVYFTAVFLLDTCYRSNWKDWILPGVLFVILSLPTIVPTMSAFQINAVNKEHWLRVSEVRMPFHLYPLTWEQYRFNLFFAFISCYAILLYLRKKDMDRLFKHGMIWLAVSICWLIYAFAAAYVVKSPTMLVMHPARGTDLFFAFAAIAMIVVFASLIENKTTNKRVYVVLFFFSIFWLWFYEFTFIMELVFLIIAIAVIWDRFWKRILKEGNPPQLSNIVVLIVMLLGLITFSIQVYSDRVITLIRYPKSQIQEVSRWAEENTSIDDVFLIDPNWSEFRALSQRPVFVTWKDGTAMLWERSFASEWVTRIESFGFSFEKTDESGTADGFRPLTSFYENMDDKDVFTLSSSYPIRFWVVSVDHTSSFPVVFQTTGYKVLDLKP
ncbi:MAG: DUF6798 domain-containing protein [Anaerolineales bacterium]